ncbi:MAG: PilZ domain-containing protein [Pseudomonadales bacterium]|jgi:hypothetical protein|nr:PilZ domain-containing protein [Pseudomonadales bacterium]
MTDNRTNDRKTTDSKIVVVDLDSGENIGSLLNISISGLMLLSQSPIELDKLYRLEIRLTSKINGKSVLQVGADALWNNALSGDQYFWTGFQIIDISENDLTIIRQFLVDE